MRHSSVLHADLPQPLGGREAQSRSRAVHELIDPHEGPPAPPDVDEGARDPANHAVKKRVGSNSDCDPVAGAVDRDVVNAADRMATRTRTATESTEIMRPLEPFAGRLHGRNIQPIAQAPCVLALISAPREGLTDPVRIESGTCRIAGVEGAVHQLGGSDRNVRSE